MDDQTAAREALGKIRHAIVEIFPSLILPRGAADTIAAEAVELATAIRQLKIDA